MAIDPKSYDFAVYFKKVGDNKLQIIVETPEGKKLIKGKPMAKNPLNNVNQLHPSSVP